jgi:hypothetical protein
VAGNGQIQVTFTPPADNGNPITRYSVSCTSSDGGVFGAQTGAASPITVTGLTNGNTYTCTVVATNTDGDSTPSSPSLAVIPSTVPDAPAQPTDVAGNGQIQVTFTPPADNGNPITRYTASCVSSDGGTPGNQSDPASPITVTGLTNGNTYTCTVIATNTDGDSTPSSPSLAVVPSTVPDAPAQPTVTAGNGQIQVTFTAPAANGNPITGYTVNCISSNGGAPGNQSDPAPPITVTGLTNGHTYTCAVTATNLSGTGPASIASAAVVPSTVPSRPAAPTISAGNTLVHVAYRAPASNGGSRVTQYRLRCVSTNGGVARTVTPTANPWTVTGLTNGATYSCEAAAVNARGASAYSPASNAVIPFTRGFRLFSGDGGVFTFGQAGYYGSAKGKTVSRVISMAATPDNRGYWLAANDGEVFAFGDAHNYGSISGRSRLPVVGMAATPTGHGYWLVASDGGVFSFGDAHYYGSTGGIRLRQSIIAMTTTPSGRGYWLLASDGGIFTFGDAIFRGSAVGRSMAPIVGFARTASGHGYWITDSVGNVFNFGDAPRLGSVPRIRLRLPIMGIATTITGRGYWVAAGDGGVFAFGDAPFIGWSGPLFLQRIIRGVSR